MGCDPRSQLLVWDARTNGSRPVVTATLGYLRDSAAPYLCVASQPFTPEVRPATEQRNPGVILREENEIMPPSSLSPREMAPICAIVCEPL